MRIKEIQVLELKGFRVKATKNFIGFAVFVSFFPQLVAGPIERAYNLLPQIHASNTSLDSNYYADMMHLNVEVANYFINFIVKTSLNQELKK